MPARQRAPAWRRVAAALAASASVACMVAGGAGAVSVVPQVGSGTIVVDGAVNAIVTTGTTVVIGGAFSHAGPYTGGFASAPAAGGSATSLPAVNGTVNAVVADGSGGWYVGGSFTSVGSSSISNLVHITSADAIDSSWVPAPNGQVNALALSGGTLFVGGAFTTIGGTSRNYLASLTAATGAATSWNPNPDGTVSDLALSPSGSTLYVSGSFANIGTSSRAGLGAVDTSSGSVGSWNPNPSPAASVNALAVSPDGTTVYAGGTFTNIGGNPLTRLAAISASTGTSNSSWAPAPNGTVNALALSSDGGTVYAGGTFTLIGSVAQARNYLAAVSTSNPGNPTSWDPSVTGSSVNALGLSSDGGTLYVGGSFTTIGGQSRQNLAALSTSSGAAATSWQEDANAAPNAIAVTSSAIGVGGSFAAVGMQSRSELAAFSTSGSLLDFNPGASGGAVNALAVSPDGSTVYAGGAFSTVGGVSRSKLAAVSLATGATTSWQPGTTPAATVDAIATASISGDVDVYVGNTGSGANARLQAFLGSTGATPSGWSPVNITAGAVNAITLSPDQSVLFVGGSYTGGTSPRAEALNPSTGAAATGWTQPTISNNAVLAIAFSSDSTRAYLGGTFTTPSQHLVAVDDTGSVVWNGNVAGAASVQVAAVAVSGSTVYAGGTFTSTVGANTLTRTRLAALDATSANASSWSPAPDSTVSAIAATSSGVYVGGSFANIGSTALPDLALFTLSAPAASTSPSISGTLALGSTLTCSTGTWSNSPTGFTYQWLRDGSAIAGATSSTYVAGTSDVGHQLSCTVTATNGEGSASSTSGSFAIVSTPTNTGAPVITGAAAVGSALTCDPGTWTGTPTYSYAWLRDGVAVAGATAATYTAATADAGHALSCRVTGANGAGSAIATSAGVVIPASASTGTSTPPQAASGGNAVSVAPGAGGTLTTSGGVTATWQTSSFSAAGTLALTPYVLAGDVNGFSRTSPIVSLTYTSPGASVPAPVFLATPVVVVFPKAQVPPAPFVAYSEDGLTYTPLPKLAKDTLPAAGVDGYFRRPDGSIAIWTRHTSLYALLRDVQPPTRPTTLVATLKGKLLRLRWTPAADNSRVIARYEIVRGAHTIVAKEPGTRTSAGFSLRRLKTTSIYRVRAVDAAGNAGALSPSIRVVVSRGKVSLRP